MPWDSSDAKRFSKKASSTPRLSRRWSHVANSALKRGESEGTAIRMASGVTKRGESQGSSYSSKEYRKETSMAKGGFDSTMVSDKIKGNSGPKSGSGKAPKKAFGKMPSGKKC